MSLIWCRENWHGRKGTDAEQQVRRYVRAFQALTSDPKDGPVTVLAAPELPKIGDGYVTPNEQDLSALCIGRDPVNDDDHPELWQILCDYSTLQKEQDAGGDNPLLEPAKISGDSERIQKALQYADAKELFLPFSGPIDGTKVEGPLAITNTANDPFDPPPTRDDDRDVLTITKNLQLSVSELIALRRQYRNRTNLDQILGSDPGHVKVDALNWGNDKRSNVKFKVVTARFTFSDDGFFYEPMNAGYRELISGVKHNILDGGQLVPRPHPLSLGGQKDTTSDPKSILYCRFQLYRSTALAPLLELLGFEE